jgi:hypothetical protein
MCFDAYMKVPIGPLGRGIVVLGMHRSGTSAVTGVIDALGLPACRPDDRMPVRRWNARGNYESRSLSRFDERLLSHLGGAWWAPPTLREGWAENGSLLGFRAEAAGQFADAHPFQNWVWKDPRACVLMPFWDLVLGPDMPRIVVLRNPLESAASLESRNRMPRELALALAERSLHSAIRDSAGRPVLVTAYDELFDDLRGWCHRVAEFIRTNGLAMPGPLAVKRAQGFLDAELRHHLEVDFGPESGGSEGLRRLWTWARERIGAHAALSIEGLPNESLETEALLHAQRRAPGPSPSTEV